MSLQSLNGNKKENDSCRFCSSSKSVTAVPLCPECFELLRAECEVNFQWESNARILLQVQCETKMPSVSFTGVMALLKMKNQGKEMPVGWKKAAVQYHIAKEKLWQIRVIDFKKRQAEHNRMMHICELLERGE